LCPLMITAERPPIFIDALTGIDTVLTLKEWREKIFLTEHVIQIKLDKKMEDHPLCNLQDIALGEYRIHLQRLKPLRLSGWVAFSVALKDREGIPSSLPVVEGIYSKGGKDNIKPWMDISLAGFAEFRIGKRVDLHVAGLMQGLLRSLSRLIPPGGHMMISYEDKDSIHRETHQALSKGVPPIITPLGLLLFYSGFRLVKDWYLAEGGYEGPRKLWGEKPSDRSWSMIWDERTARELVDFFNTRKGSTEQKYIKELQMVAREVLANLDIKDSTLRNTIEDLF